MGEDNNEGAGRLAGQLSFRRYLPNIITLLAICAGLTAIRYAWEGNLRGALLLMLLAGLLDSLDGRIARLLKSASPFGAQLDGLADFVNFGVAPAMILYIWRLGDLGGLGWVAVLIYALAIMLRLARFNVASSSQSQPKWQAGFFTGVPSVAASVVVLLPFHLENLGLPKWAGEPKIIAIYVVVVALLVVSRWPTWSGKQLNIRFSWHRTMQLILMLVLTIGLVYSYPFLMCALFCLVYLATLPFSRP